MTQALTTTRTTPQTIYHPDHFEAALRFAKALAESDMVPQTYRGKVGNCLTALDYAQAMNLSPQVVMANLYMVHGMPAFKGSFAATLWNLSRYGGRLQYKTGEGKRGKWCRAWAKLVDGNVIEGPIIDEQLARDEKWGPKWKTMAEQMLMYRAASWFVRAHAPELLVGLYTADELEDGEHAIVVDVAIDERDEPTPVAAPAQVLQAAQSREDVIDEYQRRTRKIREQLRAAMAAPEIDPKLAEVCDKLEALQGQMGLPADFLDELVVNVRERLA